MEPVGAGEDKRLARSMMATWHPEGEACAPGARVSYWITSSRHGRLGGLVFGAASWHQKARDDFIGWSQGARVAHLGEIVNHDRFLILPSVHVRACAETMERPRFWYLRCGWRVHRDQTSPFHICQIAFEAVSPTPILCTSGQNRDRSIVSVQALKELASHALACACRRLAADGHEKYGVRPVLAYTYVGPEHSGVSYRAAGWERCEETTSGRPPGAPGPSVSWARRRP